MTPHEHTWFTWIHLSTCDVQDCACGARRRARFDLTGSLIGVELLSDPRGSLFNCVEELQPELYDNSTLTL